MESNELPGILKTAPIIVAHDRNDYIRIYFEPSNFRLTKTFSWQFDCKAYVSAMPSRLKSNKLEFTREDKITETIIHRKDWQTFKEWSTNLTNLSKLFDRIF